MIALRSVHANFIIAVIINLLLKVYCYSSQHMFAIKSCHMM